MAGNVNNPNSPHQRVPSYRMGNKTRHDDRAGSKGSHSLTDRVFVLFELTSWNIKERIGIEETGVWEWEGGKMEKL